MPYEVLGSEVQVLLKQDVDDEGEKNDAFTHYSKTFFKGQKVEDKDISNVVADQYKAGNEHVRALLKYVEEEVPAKKPGRPPKAEVKE